MGVTGCSERSSCPCLCSGVVRLAHRKCEVMAQYHVQTAYVRFKVLYEENRAQCGHYNPLLSSIRMTLRGCTVNNLKNWKIEQPHKVLFAKNTAHATQRWILSGEVSGKMNRVCCGAVNSFVDFSSRKWWVSR